MDKFEPDNKAHVMWLKKLTEANTEDKFKILNKNPMNHEFSGIEMIHALFGLCARYTQGVFQRKAFIPQEDDC